MLLYKFEGNVELVTGKSTHKQRTVTEGEQLWQAEPSAVADHLVRTR